MLEVVEVAVTLKSDATAVVEPVDPETAIVQLMDVPTRAEAVFKHDKLEDAEGVP